MKHPLRADEDSSDDGEGDKEAYPHGEEDGGRTGFDAVEGEGALDDGE